MERVIVTAPFVGICHMQVCAESDATDEEILAVCNRENPSGTTCGWGHVVRTIGDGDHENMKPLPCADEKGRTHFLVAC